MGLLVGMYDLAARAYAASLTGKTFRRTMSEAATTTLSSKGQVVIPEEIRVRLGLKTGAQFVVGAARDRHCCCHPNERWPPRSAANPRWPPTG